MKSKVPFYKGVNEFHYNGHKRYPDSVVSPVHYAQVQLEMLCTGKGKAYLVIVSPRNGATMFTIYKDDEWLAQAIKWIIWWHERYVSGAQKIRLPRVDSKVYHDIEGHSEFLQLTARNCATATATKISITDVPYTEAEHQPMFLGDEIANADEGESSHHMQECNMILTLWKSRGLQRGGNVSGCKCHGD